MVLSISVILVLLAADIFAQGESAVPFLLIAPGARTGGMGEAGVALANDATAVFWNPAGLAFQYENPEEDSRGEIKAECRSQNPEARIKTKGIKTVGAAPVSVLKTERLEVIIIGATC